MTEELGSGDHVTASVRLLRPLAQGGMGMVWVAEHLVLDTEVVVKLMTKEVEGHASAAARFTREAAVAAAVKSPHVVQVFDSGVTAGGVAFIVMELLDGHDLGAHLMARGRLAPSEVGIIIGQLGKALAKAHRVGVVHRDLKPDNIFLCEVEGDEPFVKLLDFGTAKDEVRAPNATTIGQLIGTPYYMSPEQILGERVDARTDIWSLGVVAYEALTGRRPFEGVTVGAITLAIHTTSPRLTEVVPELPQTLDDWFARACAREPAARFPSVRAAADALTRAIAGEAPLEDAAPSSSDDDASGMASSRVPTLTPSVATSLSSTLASTRHKGRRTTLSIAALVAVGTASAMVALIRADRPARAPTAALSVPSSTPLASPSVLPLASASPPASASASPPASASASPPASASPSLPLVPVLPAPSPFPFASPSAPAKPDLAKPPARPAPAPAPALSASARAPAPAPADPSFDPPPPPLDLHDLLPPPTP